MPFLPRKVARSAIMQEAESLQDTPWAGAAEESKERKCLLGRGTLGAVRDHSFITSSVFYLSSWGLPRIHKVLEGVEHDRANTQQETGANGSPTPTAGQRRGVELTQDPVFPPRGTAGSKPLTLQRMDLSC